MLFADSSAEVTAAAAAAQAAARNALVMSIVTAVLTFLGIVFSGVMAYLVAKLNTKQAAAADKVDKVATDLASSTTATTDKLDTVQSTANTIVEGNTLIHNLANSAFAKVERKLELMEEKFNGAERIIAQMQEEKRAIATALTDRQREQSPIPSKTATPLPDSAVATLEKIETNTAVIADHVTTVPGVLKTNGRKNEKHVGEGDLHE